MEMDKFVHNSQNFIIPNVPPENVKDYLVNRCLKRYLQAQNHLLVMRFHVPDAEYCNLALVETKERLRKLQNT